MQNPDSVFAFYKKAIELRKTHKALVYGEFRRATGIPAPLYCYYREYNGELYYVELNLGRKPLAHPIDVSRMQLLLSTRTDKGDNLRPFEGNIVKAIPVTDFNAFEQDMSLYRGIIREDVRVIDAAAYVAGYVTVAGE